MNRIGKILPIDGFIAIVNDTPPVDYVQSLTHLYQPLIGIQAVSLYQTLLNESNYKQANLQTHHTLMNYLQIPLPDLYEARLKLEGIGLLKTFYKTSNDKTAYTYELQKPFTPKQFFRDAMLSQLLYHHIGDVKYLQLEREYAQTPKSNGEEITASFNDVFQTFEPDFNMQDKQPTNDQNDDQILVEQLDFSWLEIMLKQRMIPVEAVLTTKNRMTISELTALYDLATYEVEKAVLWALTDENDLDVDEFKNACHDLFRNKQQQTAIQLTVKKESNEKVEETKLPKTKEGQLIQQFETMSPKQLLEDLSGGNQASEREMRMVRDVMGNQGLPAPVMNVLVHYVLIQSNMKLSRAYLETIASHWSRANLQTAKEAMDFAKKEIENFKTRKTSKKQRSSEVIPEWFKERKEGKQEPQTTPNEQDHNEQEEIMKLLRKHSSGNNNKDVQG